MSFWKVFKSEQTTEDKSKLYRDVKALFPQYADEQLIRMTCIAGLMARVAFVDFELHENEVNIMTTSLKNWTNLSGDEITKLANLACDNIKELAGLENHFYVHELKNYLDENERFELVEVLFHIAAGDGVVENLESEEIRVINKGLDLSNRHFISARAQVSDKLGALK